ncbi:MAG: hypothetical protein M1822_008328 [Bathelium mastoideum]|nr:MAG: hypothetical protein M1822_008328 [Bathelium mastoideum]
MAWLLACRLLLVVEDGGANLYLRGNGQDPKAKSSIESPVTKLATISLDARKYFEITEQGSNGRKARSHQEVKVAAVNLAAETTFTKEEEGEPGS